MLGQWMSASEEHNYTAAESISKISEELLRKFTQNKILNRTVQKVSVWSNQPRTNLMNLLRFNGSVVYTIARWILAVNRCKFALLIEDDTI